MRTTGRTVLVAFGVALVFAVLVGMLIASGVGGVMGIVEGGDARGGGWVLAIASGLVLLGAAAGVLLLVAGPERREPIADAPTYPEDNPAGGVEPTARSNGAVSAPAGIGQAPGEPRR